MADLRSPDAILQKFAELLIDLCQADSAGGSILEEDNGRKIFGWHAIGGDLPYRWRSMARYDSPSAASIEQGSSAAF